MLIREPLFINLIKKSKIAWKAFQEFADFWAWVGFIFPAVIQTFFLATFNERTIFAHFPCLAGFATVANQVFRFDFQVNFFTPLFGCFFTKFLIAVDRSYVHRASRTVNTTALILPYPPIPPAIQLKVYRKNGIQANCVTGVLRPKHKLDSYIGCHKKSGPPKFQWWYH